MNVLVIGGGVIGLATAWRLAQAGAKVRLVDRQEPGREASWAGAGMLAPGGELAEDSAFARLMIRSACLYPEFVRQLTAESGLPLDYVRCGALEYLVGDRESAVARAERQQALGIHSEFRDEALWYPDDAHVDPRQVVSALRIACGRAGVEVNLDDVQELDARRLPADAVVIAAGAWSGSLRVKDAPPLPRTRPIRGHLVAYRAEAGLLPYIVRKSHTYVFQRSNGIVIAGATEEHVGFERDVNPQSVDDVDRRAKALVPELRGLPVEDAWSGFRPAMEEGEAAIGRLGDTEVWLAYGHYRNGILGAPATAERLVQQMLGQR
jgi:glycine oxidase